MLGSAAQHQLAGDRFALTCVPPSRAGASFGDEVSRGLAQNPKTLPCRFFYDAKGSMLFEEICSLPEYYLTRAERSILEKRADEIVDLVPSNASLVELGSGSAEKTRLMIDAMLRMQPRLVFAPIDISQSALARSAPPLLQAHEGLSIHAIASDYESGLNHLEKVASTPRLILWLGSSIGNLHRKEAAEFLRGVRERMSPSDRILVGVDLRKDREILESAYDDSFRTTARFNLNLLQRINDELGGNFDLSHFEHRAVYLEDEGRVEMRLVSQRRQRVQIDELGVAADFEAGEWIHTENSYKYSEQELDELCDLAELRTDFRWRDAQHLFTLSLLSPVPRAL